MIYRYVVQAADPIVVRCQEAPGRSIRRLWLKQTTTSPVHDRSKTYALLQACRSTYLELIQIYYSRNVFEFSGIGPFNRFVLVSGNRNRRLITSVIFASVPNVPSNGADAFKKLRKLNNLTINYSDDSLKQAGYPDLCDMSRMCRLSPSLQEVVIKHTSTAWRPGKGRRALEMPHWQAKSGFYVHRLQDWLDQGNSSIRIRLIFVEIYEEVL